MSLKTWSDRLRRTQALESSYNMMKTIECEHARIHEGKAYTFAEKLTVQAGSAHNFVFSPASCDVHLRGYSFDSSHGPCDVFLYENTFFDAASAGTQVYGKNKRRTAADSSCLEVYNQPFTDVNSLGDQLAYSIISATGGGPVKAASGIAESPSGEWVLEQGKYYLVRFVNNNGAIATVGVDTFWYEAG